MCNTSVVCAVPVESGRVGSGCCVPVRGLAPSFGPLRPLGEFDGSTRLAMPPAPTIITSGTSAMTSASSDSSLERTAAARALRTNRAGPAAGRSRSNRARGSSHLARPEPRLARTTREPALPVQRRIRRRPCRHNATRRAPRRSTRRRRPLHPRARGSPGVTPTRPMRPSFEAPATSRVGWCSVPSRCVRLCPATCSSAGSRVAVARRFQWFPGGLSPMRLAWRNRDHDD